MMLSDVSDLTEISSDEEEIYTPAKRAQKRPKTKKEWRPKEVLKAPRLTHYSARTLYEEILSGKVDLEPEYQRDVVWNDAKQSNLIDSMLRNFYIPPVIFAFTQSEDGEERRTCIDGKQRLTSIQRFMDGQIPFKDSRTNLKLWYKLQPGNERGKLLPSQYKKQFDLKQVSCVEYTDINEDSEREIFQRVQLGVALTPAERMQAIAGPWPQLVREIISDMEDYKISDTLEWSKTRGRDFHSVASIIYSIEAPKKGHPGAPTLEKWLKRGTPPSKQLRKRVVDAFKIFRHLVLTPKYASVFQIPTHVSPIEFVMSVVLIDAHCRDHTLTQLADGIRRMREYVRSKHADIRANSTVAKTVLGFIKETWPKDLRKEPDERLALEECERNSIPKPLEKGKRKRSDEYYDGGSDSSKSDQSLEAKANWKAKAAKTTISDNSKPQTQSATTFSRSATPASVRNPESATNVLENTTTSESQPAPRPDRLADIRRAKQRVAQISTGSQNINIGAQASNVVNNPIPPVLFSHALSSFNKQMPAHPISLPPRPVPLHPQQFHQQMPQPNMPLGQGPPIQVMPPPAQSAPGSSAGIPHPDQRPKVYGSGPPTSNVPDVNVGAGAYWNDQNHSVPLNQRNANTPSVSGMTDTSKERVSRFDQRSGPSSSGSISRSESPRQPPAELRGNRGPTDARPSQWQSQPYEHDRGRPIHSDNDRINGRHGNRDHSIDNGWPHRNGR